MKTFYKLTLFIILINFQAARAQQPKLFIETVSQHQQLYSSSCIPSSIEMILKYNGKVKSNYFNLQNGWKERRDGTFADFDGKTINGIKFTQQFKNTRGVNFPYDSLYKTISDELKSGRKVIISLVSGQNMWHIWVIDHKLGNGDFVAYSRDYNMSYPLVVTNLKKIIKTMGGTDIITYRVL